MDISSYIPTFNAAYGLLCTAMYLAMIPLYKFLILLSQHCLLSLSAIHTYSCIPCLMYMPIKSTVPKYHSEFPMVFYSYLVSFINIRLIYPD